MFKKESKQLSTYDFLNALIKEVDIYKEEFNITKELESILNTESDTLDEVENKAKKITVLILAKNLLSVIPLESLIKKHLMNGKDSFKSTHKVLKSRENTLALNLYNMFVLFDEIDYYPFKRHIYSRIGDNPQKFKEYDGFFPTNPKHFKDYISIQNIFSSILSELKEFKGTEYCLPNEHTFLQGNYKSDYNKLGLIENYFEVNYFYSGESGHKIFFNYLLDINITFQKEEKNELTLQELILDAILKHLEILSQIATMQFTNNKEKAITLCKHDRTIKVLYKKLQQMAGTILGKDIWKSNDKQLYNSFKVINSLITEIYYDLAFTKEKEYLKVSYNINGNKSEYSVENVVESIELDIERLKTINNNIEPLVKHNEGLINSFR